MQEALFYTQLENAKTRCELCPWLCELQNGQTGNCKVRTNQNGTLITQVFNKVAAFGIDPIEKKPLYHFSPGKNILSIGEVGCNLHCKFCQNHRISQFYASEYRNFEDATSEQIVYEAQKTHNNIGIAYTYNEPFTFFEFMLETAKLAHKKSLKNVVVSNGYINPEPLQQILPHIDAFNIDLKAFTNGFYKMFTKGKLQPVLEVLKIIARNNTHLEITNLVIPGLNDDEKQFAEMINWIVTELGEDVPLHLSRYFPQHEMEIPPTPASTLETLFEIAKKQLQYVYLGNVSNDKHSSTMCANCNEILIKRKGYKTDTRNLSHDGRCKKCNHKLKIVM